MNNLLKTVFLSIATISMVACTSSSGLTSSEVQTTKNEIIAANKKLNPKEQFIFNYEKSRFQVSENKVYVYTSARHLLNKDIIKVKPIGITRENNYADIYLQVWKKRDNQWNLMKTEIETRFKGNEPQIVHDDS